MMFELRIVCTAYTCFTVKKRFYMLNTQIGFNGYQFNFTNWFRELPIRTHIKINTKRWHNFTFVQAKCTNPIFRQHRDFIGRKIHRTQSLKNNFLNLAVWFNRQRRCGDVNPHTFHATAQILYRQRVIYFGRGHIINGKRLYICH